MLYVGKARTLKNRVNSYTQIAQLPKRLLQMVGQTRSMTIGTTRTEAEALLEAQLIKRFRPPYNVLLRDDKSFPFILLREDHPFPQVGHRRPACQGQYFGRRSAGSVTNTLNALQSSFFEGVVQTAFLPTGRGLACSIRSGAAPHAVGRISEADYAELVEDAKQFLAGKSTGVQARQARWRGRREAGFRADRGLSRSPPRLTCTGQPDDPCRGSGRRRYFRAGVQGRADVHPGVLYPRRAGWGHTASPGPPPTFRRKRC